MVRLLEPELEHELSGNGTYRPVGIPEVQVKVKVKCKWAHSRVGQSIGKRRLSRLKLISI